MKHSALFCFSRITFEPNRRPFVSGDDELLREMPQGGGTLRGIFRAGDE